MKTCRICKSELDESMFYKNIGKRCKECHKTISKQINTKNSEKISENKKSYYEKVIVDRRNKKRDEVREERQNLRAQRKKEATERAQKRRIEKRSRNQETPKDILPKQ